MEDIVKSCSVIVERIAEENEKNTELLDKFLKKYS